MLAPRPRRKYGTSWRRAASTAPARPPETRRLGVPAQGAAHAAHPVGDDRLAVARAAEHDSALGVARRHRLGHRADVERVVDRRLRGVGAEVLDVMALPAQVLLDRFL